MALPYPIAATQTDVKSPIDAQLMDALRLNQEYLDAQVGGASAGGIISFRVNGFLNRIKALLAIGGGKRLDGGIISNNVTFANAKLYLEKGGTSGALEVDVLRHKEVQHAIKSVTAQHTGATQAVGRLGSSESTQAVSPATPTISTQVITKPTPAENITTIADLGNDNFLYTFSGTTLLGADYEVGDSILFSGATNAANDGEYVITQVNYDGLPSVVVVNALGVEQTAAAGTGVLSLYQYTYLAAVDDDIVAGEQIIMAGHTSAASDGTFTIYKTNQGGNNIQLKYAGGVEQGGIAGTAAGTRWLYAFSSTLADTQYIVGEKAFFTGHTSAANDGKFIIRRVNEAGNNLYVTNALGVAQGGSGGTADTLRWLYSTNGDTSADISVNDKIVLAGHTNVLNDGTFTVLTVNRFAVNNLEVYNEDGIAQAGAAGTYTTVLKLVHFKEDFNADYVAGTSKAAIEGLKTITGSTIDEYDIVEVNRGGFSNYNIVLDAEALLEQLPSSGRVAREVRTIFLTRPRIEIAQENKIRNLQIDTSATFVAGSIDADTILTIDVIEVPEGLPSTMVLSLS